MKHTKQSIISKDGVSYLIPFILITSCFALWGFANDITNPMVKAFSKIFRMSATDGALVQVAFYGGYFAMAFLLPCSSVNILIKPAYYWDLGYMLSEPSCSFPPK